MGANSMPRALTLSRRAATHRTDLKAAVRGLVADLRRKLAAREIDPAEVRGLIEGLPNG